MTFYKDADKKFQENYFLQLERRDAVQKITKAVQRITKIAERIHLGVQCQRLYVEGAQLVANDTTISRRAVLISSILDSFEAILKMLLETVKVSWPGLRFKDQHRPEATSRALQYGRESCELLEQSKEQIIMQADEDLPFVNQNSCLSPEKLLITTLERLVHGVSSNGTIDVIGVYKACLENLVSSL